MLPAAWSMTINGTIYYKLTMMYMYMAWGTAGYLSLKDTDIKQRKGYPN